MKCARFAGARVLEAFDEETGSEWTRHRATCECCAEAVDDFREIRRLYAAARPVALNVRTRRAILASLRRERTKSRLRSVVAGLVGVAAAFLIFAGGGGAPTIVAAAERLPEGAVIDRGLGEIHERLDVLTSEPRSYIDVNLDDLKHRLSSLTWDDESM